MDLFVIALYVVEQLLYCHPFSNRVTHKLLLPMRTCCFDSSCYSLLYWAGKVSLSAPSTAAKNVQLMNYLKIAWA